MSGATLEGDAPPYTRQIADMLGLRSMLRRRSQSAVVVHEALLASLPGRTVLKALETAAIPAAQLLPVFGISVRTFMRLKAEPDKLLDADRSGRVWRFMQLLAKARDVLGSTQLAVEWMRKPAMALENRRPIELLTTEVGAGLVDEVIERMRFGVYQ
jgi:putative toxin-antitoxin system antitoxin component (TIGR02293 family)